MNRTENACEIEEQLLSEKSYTLMLLNDDVNTFDYVIDNLMELCHHTYEQAFQCAWITHCYGKCDVLHGSREKVAGVAEIMTRRGLTVKITK
ncbi:MAG: ATP-dependent Clp protease adaptor ClpS [Bacteroidales bacterium]|nr:ATP-dependent Clp protease adaptor ClpS [Bacteroidales bacterium]